MKNLRTRLLLIICSGLMGLLAACGDSAATPTVVVPTATTAPIAEATATTATMPEATSTTATMPEATATTATMPEATATTATMPEATATTATIPDATATTGGGSASLPAPLQNAGQAMQGLKSYHFAATTEMGATGTTSVEGDVIPPDKISMTSTTDMAGQKFETRIIMIGATTWTNVGGQWTKAEGMPAPMNPTSMAGSMEGVTAAEDLGETTLDGKVVHHIRYTVDNAGTGPVTSEAWIDKETNYIVQIQTEADTAAGKTSTTMKFSRFDDPTIVIEEPQ